MPLVCFIDGGLIDWYTRGAIHFRKERELLKTRVGLL